MVSVGRRSVGDGVGVGGLLYWFVMVISGFLGVGRLC